MNTEWNCDKGRFAFRYAAANERLTTPLVRRDGELRPASWPEAWAAAAAGLAAPARTAGSGVLPGGRLTVEDAYAYAKFARVALGTHDVDARARAHSAEELAFLAAHVAGTAPGAVPGSGAVTYDELAAAPPCSWSGSSPRRSRRSSSCGCAGPSASARCRCSTSPPSPPRPTRSSTHAAGHPPGLEAAVLRALATESAGGVGAEAATALRETGAVVLAGERLAEVPGALSALSALAAASGARIAWVPRRAGERGAVEVGALPNLLPGGRGVTDAADRPTSRPPGAWSCPARRAATSPASCRPPATDASAGCSSAGSTPPTCPTRAGRGRAGRRRVRGQPRAVPHRGDRARRRRAPVAAAPEKAAATSTGRAGCAPSTPPCTAAGSSPTPACSPGWPTPIGVRLGVSTVDAARRELVALAAPAGRARSRAGRRPGRQPRVGAEQAVLASWRQLLDDGTAARRAGAGRHRPPAVVRLAKDTAVRLGVADGEPVTVTGRAGLITCRPASPTCPTGWSGADASPGSHVRSALGSARRRRHISAGGAAMNDSPTLADFGQDVWWLVLIKIVGVFGCWSS